jgi:hypothetical protein
LFTHSSLSLVYLYNSPTSQHNNVSCTDKYFSVSLKLFVSPNNTLHTYHNYLTLLQYNIKIYIYSIFQQLPFQECVVSKGLATSTADHLFLRPGENRLDKHPQNPWEAINGCETGMPLIITKTVITKTSWPKDGYYTANKRSTDHGPRDVGPVVPTV